MTFAIYVLTCRDRYAPRLRWCSAPNAFYLVAYQCQSQLLKRPKPVADFIGRISAIQFGFSAAA